MMLDDGLRLASSHSCAVSGFTLTSIGTFVDLGVPNYPFHTADPSSMGNLGCFMKVEETFAGAVDLYQMFGFAVVVGTGATPAIAASGSSEMVGASEVFVPSAVAAASAFRPMPVEGDEIFFRLNPLRARTASGTNPVTQEDYYLENQYPRWAGLVIWTGSWQAGITAVASALTAGKVSAWLTDKVPTIKRLQRDHRSFRSG